MKREPRQELRDRAIKGYRYLLRGVAASEIAQIEKIPLRTIYWLIQEGGRLLGGELKTLTETGLLREPFVHHQERKKELWFLYSTTRKATCFTQHKTDPLKGMLIWTPWIDKTGIDEKVDFWKQTQEWF